MAALAKDGKPTRYIICPCVLPHEPNACMDPGCLEANECLDLKYGGDEVKAIAAVNQAVGEERPKNLGAAETSHVCPHDKDPCFMLTCKGGQECYAKAKAENKGSTTQTYSYSSSSHSTASEPCHSGMVSIGKVGKAEIFLGKEWDAKKWDWDQDGPIGLVIGLLGDPYPQGPAVGVNSKAMEFKGMDKLMYVLPQAPNIWIKWPDYGIVPFKKAWWHQLMNILEDVEGAVLIYCMGGHGRTGTAAAIIASLGGLVPANECPVEWLRSVYCEKVVESESQLAYIGAITGRKVTATMSKGYTYYGTGAYEGSTYTGQGSALTPLTKPGADSPPWDEKKKSPHGGRTSRGSGHGKDKANRQKADPQRLSIKKWKQWWRRQTVATVYPHLVNVTRPKDLPDGQIFKIGKREWQWNKDEHVFIDHKKASRPAPLRFCREYNDYCNQPGCRDACIAEVNKLDDGGMA